MYTRTFNILRRRQYECVTWKTNLIGPVMHLSCTNNQLVETQRSVSGWYYWVSMTAVFLATSDRQMFTPFVTVIHYRTRQGVDRSICLQVSPEKEFPGRRSCLRSCLPVIDDLHGWNYVQQSISMRNELSSRSLNDYPKFDIANSILWNCVYLFSLFVSFSEWIRQASTIGAWQIGEMSFTAWK